MSAATSGKMLGAGRCRGPTPAAAAGRRRGDAAQAAGPAAGASRRCLRSPGPPCRSGGKRGAGVCAGLHVLAAPAALEPPPLEPRRRPLQQLAPTPARRQQPKRSTAASPTWERRGSRHRGRAWARRCPAAAGGAGCSRHAADGHQRQSGACQASPQPLQEWGRGAEWARARQGLPQGSVRVSGGCARFATNDPASASARRRVHKPARPPPPPPGGMHAARGSSSVPRLAWEPSLHGWAGLPAEYNIWNGCGRSCWKRGVELTSLCCGRNVRGQGGSGGRVQAVEHSDPSCHSVGGG